MESGLSASASGKDIARGEQRGSKRQARVPADQLAAEAAAPPTSQGRGAMANPMSETIQILSKLTLANTQDVRALRGISMTTYLVPVQSPVQEALANAGSAYSEAVSKLTPEEKRAAKLGIPAYHRWNALLSHYLARLDGAPKAAIQAYIDDMATKSEAERMIRLSDGLRHLVLRKSYNRDVKKVEVAFVPTSAEDRLWREVIRPLFVAEDGVRAVAGAPPPGDLERKLQARLNA